jgi:hypothetical protein
VRGLVGKRLRLITGLLTVAVIVADLVTDHAIWHGAAKLRATKRRV